MLTTKLKAGILTITTDRGEVTADLTGDAVDVAAELERAAVKLRRMAIEEAKPVVLPGSCAYGTIDREDILTQRSEGRTYTVLVRVLPELVERYGAPGAGTYRLRFPTATAKTPLHQVFTAAARRWLNVGTWDREPVA